MSCAAIRTKKGLFDAVSFSQRWYGLMREGMNDAPFMRQLAHRIMTQQFGTSQDPQELASAALIVHTKLLTSLSPLLGEIGSNALLRRSLRLTEGGFPCFTEVGWARQEGLMNALDTCLRNQAPDVVRDASIAMLASFFELLAALIGERLTRQLLQEAWPDQLMSPL